MPDALGAGGTRAKSGADSFSRLSPESPQKLPCFAELLLRGSIFQAKAAAFPTFFRQALQKIPPLLQDGFPCVSVFQTKTVLFRIARRCVRQAGRFQDILRQGRRNVLFCRMVFPGLPFLKARRRQKTFSAGFRPARQGRFFKTEKRAAGTEAAGRSLFLEKILCPACHRSRRTAFCVSFRQCEADSSAAERRACPIVRTGRFSVFLFLFFRNCGRIGVWLSKKAPPAKNRPALRAAPTVRCPPSPALLSAFPARRCPPLRLFPCSEVCYEP